MIRKAKKADYNAMDSVFRAAAKQLCIASYDMEIIDAWAGKCWPERFVKSANDGNHQYVLLIDDVVVCFGSINLEKQLLVSLFVSPDYAGQGLGQRMIEFLISLAKHSGVELLQIDSSLNAVSFYSRNGFREKGRSKFKTLNGVFMESVQMECALCT